MGILSNTIWAFGVLCLVGLLYRGRKLSLFARYSYFYTYLSLVMGKEIIRIAQAIGDPSLQQVWTIWILEVSTAVAGFGITWEIYKQSLIPYPGARRMAQLLLSGVLTAILLKAIVELANDPTWAGVPKMGALEQNLRVSQALLLTVLVCLIGYYGIPLGKNVWSMLFGYGLVISSNVIILTLRLSLPHVDWKWWSLLIQLEYCGTLSIWYMGMRSFMPNPISQTAPDSD